MIWEHFYYAVLWIFAAASAVGTVALFMWGLEQATDYWEPTKWRFVLGVWLGALGCAVLAAFLVAAALS